MRQVFIGVLALLSMSSVASTDKDSGEAIPVETLLTQMHTASATLDFELSYILVRKNNIEPLRYRHSVIENERYRQLLYLAGPAREVIKIGEAVSYFETGLEPFTIKSEKMVAPLPAIINADFRALAENYDYVSLGRGREAGLSCNVVRISSKSGERYSYVVWISQDHNLLVRADLLDRAGEPIEQFRTVSLDVSTDLKSQMQALSELDLPSEFSIPSNRNVDLQWEVKYLPKGFESVYRNRHRLFMTGRPVESQMFTDGLFNFSVYLANADELSAREQLARKGGRTLHSHVLGSTEITVVGDLPPLTAKKIAESVRFLPKSVLNQTTNPSKTASP